MMLKRNILYTGITRAKKKVYLLVNGTQSARQSIRTMPAGAIQLLENGLPATIISTLMSVSRSSFGSQYKNISTYEERQAIPYIEGYPALFVKGADV